MAQQKSKLVVTNLSKGLYSDFNELVSPQGVTIDEDNCEIDLNGIRSTRLGFKKEDNSTDYGTLVSSGGFPDFWLDNFLWTPVANISNLVFCVFQVGGNLYFYDASNEPLSDGRKSFTVDLTTFKIAGATSLDVYSNPVSVTSAKGALFVCGKNIDPFYIEYDFDSDSISTTAISVQIRDFVQQENSIDIDAITTVGSETNSLKYDLLNQGWGNLENQDPLDYYISKDETQINVAFLSKTSTDYNTPLKIFTAFESKYPSRNGQWFLGHTQIPDTGGTNRIYQFFQYHIWGTSTYGNGAAPYGHYIVDAFNIDRSDVSGVDGFDPEVSTTRPTAIASYASRIFYLHNNSIYFSQLIQDDLGVTGRCYQQGDPTSENFADLLATDGGYVTIQEMGHGVALFVLKRALIIFADNGIWTLTGTQGDSFSPDAYSISKISSVGLLSPKSLTDTDGSPYWWANNGIYTLVPSNINPSLFDEKNILEGRLMNFYKDQNEIPDFCKNYAKGSYDPYTKTVTWWYRDSVEATPSQWKFVYNKALNYSLIFDAFFPYSISTDFTVTDDTDKTGIWIAGQFNAGKVFLTASEVNVVNSVGVSVVNSGAVQVIANAYNLAEINHTAKYWVFQVGDAHLQSTGINWNFGVKASLYFSDFSEDVRGDDGNWGFNYSAYLDTFWHQIEDPMTMIQSPYVYTFLRNTDSSLYQDGSTFYGPDRGDYVTIDPPTSGLFLESRWRFETTDTSKNWGSTLRPKQQIFLHRVQLPGASTLDASSVDDGIPVVVRRNKVRGRGRVLQLRFSNEFYVIPGNEDVNTNAGKDFQLLGYGVWGSKNSDV